MRVLVTGGAGFIGSHLVRALLARGDRVRVLDNFSTGRIENLSGLNGSLRVIEGDLRNLHAVEQAVKGIELVFHQAAMVSVPQSMHDPDTCFEVNVQGSLNLFEAARRAGVTRVVAASSCAVYGDSDALPLQESGKVTSLSPYAASKQAMEVYAEMYTRAFDLPVVSLRYFNVYGPGQNPDSDYAAVIPIFIRRALEGQALYVHGDGRQQRDFIYVGDVGRANLMATAAPDAPGSVYNVCTGEATSLLDLVKSLSRELHGALKTEFSDARAGDIYRSLGDPAKAFERLGFQAQTDLAEGLHRTVSAMREVSVSNFSTAFQGN